MPDTTHGRTLTSTERSVGPNMSRRQHSNGGRRSVRMVGSPTIMRPADPVIAPLYRPRGMTSPERDIIFRQNSGGLTSGRIDRFATFNADKKSVDEGCTICIDGVEINKLMIKLDCSHFYCSVCIRKWFENKAGCPLCRRVYHNWRGVGLQLFY